MPLCGIQKTEKSAKTHQIREYPYPIKGAKMLHKEITSEIIAAFYAVYNTLGYGFLEKVYENALILELRKKV